VRDAPPPRRREAARWRRNRQFVCLVAEDAASGQLLGTATCSMLRPEALLPAPLPSGAPWRAYVSNMAVLQSARRRGVARALLDASLRLGECPDGVWDSHPGAQRGMPLRAAGSGLREQPWLHAWPLMPGH